MYETFIDLFFFNFLILLDNFFYLVMLTKINYRVIILCNQHIYNY